MLNNQQSQSGPELRSGPLITAAAFVGAGAGLAIVGFAIGGTHLFQAIKSWMDQMEVPPSERAKMAVTQAKAAYAAGADAWQKTPQQQRR